MAQLNLKGMATDVFHSVPREGSKAREESMYVTCADGDNGGVLKFKFPGLVEFKPGQLIEGMAAVSRPSIRREGLDPRVRVPRFPWLTTLPVQA
jgi:hypothetical protein